MGFLDRLLGRSKDVASDVGDTTQEYGGKGVDAAEDVGDTAKDAFDRDKGESETTESEQRLDDVRDQVMRDEDRMP